MEIIDFIIEYIASHWWASIVLLLLYIGYEIAVRRLPTDSPYWSIVHMIGKVLKYVGKMVIKLIGENMSKKLDEKPNDDDVDFVEIPKKKKRKFLKHE